MCPSESRWHSGSVQTFRSSMQASWPSGSASMACCYSRASTYRPIVREARMLGRRVKSDVTDVNSGSQRHTERLNRAIQIHIIENILIVPDSSRWVGYLVADKPEAVVSGIRLQAIHRRACPCPDGRLHSRSVTCWEKEKLVVPLTMNWRYEALLYMLHSVGCA